MQIWQNLWNTAQTIARQVYHEISEAVAELQQQQAPKQEPPTTSEAKKPQKPRVDPFAKPKFEGGGPAQAKERFVVAGININASDATRTAFTTFMQNTQPVPADKMPPRLMAAFEKIVPTSTSPVPHAGVRTKIPWDFAALARADVNTRAALLDYTKPSFVNAAPAHKKAILDALKPVLLPSAVKELERLHLPRGFALDSQAKPVTMALESETSNIGTLTKFYAPDPTGKLDPRAMTPEFIHLLAKAQRSSSKTRPDLNHRVSDEVWAKSLRWKDLSEVARKTYLGLYQKHVDPDVVLHRITDPNVAPTGEVAPNTLQKTLKWERNLRLKIGELITDGSYSSLDQVHADRQFISKHFSGGFHLHAVVEMSTPEDVKKLGPHVTGLAALQDLSLFAQAAQTAASNYTHPFLEVWKSEDAGLVSISFDGGKIDADEIVAHKFHMVGMRTGIYGDDKRLGIEIRGALPGKAEYFDSVVERTNDILTSKNLTSIPAPPWDGWDAGDRKVLEKREKEFRAQLDKTPEGAALNKQAVLGFDDVFELAEMGGNTKNGFALFSPLWNFEALPGVTAEDKKRIQDARAVYQKELMQLAASASDGVQAGRDLKELADPTYKIVSEAAIKFFRRAGIENIVERTLNNVAAGHPANHAAAQNVEKNA